MRNRCVPQLQRTPAYWPRSFHTAPAHPILTGRVCKPQEGHPEPVCDTLSLTKAVRYTCLVQCLVSSCTVQIGVCGHGVLLWKDAGIFL